MSDSNPRAVLSDLHELRPHIWVSDLILDWTCIAGLVGLYGALGTPLWLLPVASLLIGARLHALGLLGHDVTHRLLCRRRRLNDLAEVVTGWPLLIRLEGYRTWHFEHHRTLGSDRDPELSYRSDAVYQTPVPRGRVAILFLSDLLGLGLLDLLRFGREILPEDRRRLAPIVLFWLALLALAHWLDAVWVPLLLLWSVASGFWAVFRVRTWTEHVGADASGSASSHRFHAGPLARFLFFPHNTYCHFEHHMHPQVPYYNLPAVRERTPGRPVLSLRELFGQLSANAEHPPLRAAHTG